MKKTSWHLYNGDTVSVPELAGPIQPHYMVDFQPLVDFFSIQKNPR